MQVTRSRLCIIIAVVVVYLGAFIFISTLTLHAAAPYAMTYRRRPLRPSSSSFTPKTADGGGSGVARRPAGLLSDNKRPSLVVHHRYRIQWCPKVLRFREPAGDACALASFPGSGNTWLRYLLQQATGILTGSVYKDYGLLKNGFPAENTTNGSVLVVKTHEWGPSARTMFRKAVLLVREPAAAIQAEFNRQSGGHVGFAAPERYKRTKGKYWEQFVRAKLEAWRKTNLDWLNNFAGPTHVVFYEQLVERPERTLRALLEFLEHPIDEQLFKCAIQRKEGIYRRKKKLLNFDPYDANMKRKLNAEQEVVYEAIYKLAAPHQAS